MAFNCYGSHGHLYPDMKQQKLEPGEPSPRHTNGTSMPLVFGALFLQVSSLVVCYIGVRKSLQLDLIKRQ
jgi:hypothetical protein